MRRKSDILDTFIELSKILGANRMIQRYDPILLSDKYTEEYHYEYFEKFCKRLERYTDRCVISFIGFNVLNFLTEDIEKAPSLKR